MKKECMRSKEAFLWLLTIISEDGTVLHYKYFKTSHLLQNSLHYFCVDFHVWSFEIVPFLSYMSSRTISSGHLFLCLPSEWVLIFCTFLATFPVHKSYQCFSIKVLGDYVYSTPGIFEIERKVWGVNVYCTLTVELSLRPKRERCV